MTQLPKTAAILTVGDEILIGQITNSNAAWMGEQLTLAGFWVQHHSVVADRTLSIQEELKRLIAQNDVVLVTGGLGPTDDDLTLESVANALQMELVEDHGWLKKIEEYFENRGRKMTPNNRRQARTPKGATRIDNDCGTAPGVWIPSQKGRAAIALMPGVPFEMQSMMNRFVIPELKKQNTGQAVYKKILLTAGVGESQMAQELGDVNDLIPEGVTLAWLPTLGEVKLRVTAIGDSKDHAKSKAEPLVQKLKQQFAKIIYAEDEGSLESAIGKILKERNQSIAVAESCTGGLINHRLTNVPGASHYVNGGMIAYANQVKTNELGVPFDVIESHGAVSESVARAMAEGVRKKFSADLGIGITGIAGPDGGTPDKPVGTVWIAVSYGAETFAKKWVFEKDRLRNKERFASMALSFCRHVLLKNPL